MNLLLTSLLGCLVLALPLASGEKIKWCVTSQNELNKCNRLANKTPELECFFQKGVTECLTSIKTGAADAITVDGYNVHQGGLKNYELHPIIEEKYKKGQETCYAVAVVKKDTAFTIKDLSGKKSCHDCYKSRGGWFIPIGRLISERVIPWDGPDDKSLEKAVSEFFSSSCVPGISKANYPNLCKGCKGDCSCPPKESDEPFACLKSDAGQVAFLCHNKIPSAEKQYYELLCMDGCRKSIDEYKDCHLGKEPGHAVISRKDASLSDQIFKVLSQIPSSDLFSSDEGKDLMFSDSATGLIRLPEITDSFLFLKKEYYESMRSLQVDPNSPLSVPFGRDSERGEVDAIAVDGGQVWAAEKCGLVAVMAEQYNQEKCDIDADASSYYVVAVVKKGSGVTWNNLKGKKSCHTGLNRNAGWKIPQAVLCTEKNECDLYMFFSQGCAPGADPKSNMCELCKGSGKTVGDVSKCKPTVDELYYGYDGAFRCLAEGAGDVTFIKHNIVSSYTDGNGPEWAKTLKSEDFELICPASPDKTEKISDYEKCNWASVPAHAVITREDIRNDVVNVLKDAQTRPDINLFKSDDGRNLLFSDSTKCLLEIKDSKKFLSEDYKTTIEKSITVPELVQACTLDNYVEDSGGKERGLKCGQSAIKPKGCFERVVGGCVSEQHSWPWQISLRFRKSHHCGGTLIDSQWVLTAAHCFKHNQMPEAYKIFIGIHTKHGTETSKQERDVSKIVMEPSGTDIALLKLNRPAVINDKVSLACLPENDYIVPGGTDCFATGWGDTQETGEDDELKEAGLPVIENSICNRSDFLNGSVKEHEMCAGKIQGGVDTCQGDSGGPLVCYAQNKFVLQGVTSWGIGCAQEKKPGVYVRVSKFVDWIKQSMKDKLC